MKTKRLVLLGLACCGFFAQAASADISGRYETKEDKPILDMEMTIEADEVGSVRIQSSNLNQYYLHREGVLYVVTSGSEGSTVMRVEDFLKVQQEVLTQIGWKDPPAPPPMEKSRFSPMGEEMVSGRKGVAYGIVSDEREKPVFASLVISDDPKLVRIGKAIALANTSSIKGMGQMGTMLLLMGSDMFALMEKGAPLRILSIELTDVSYDPIPVERFALPSKPLTIEEIRVATKVPKVPPPPTLPPRGK